MLGGECMSLAGIIMPCVWSGIFTFILFHLESTGLRKYQLAIVGIANIIVIPWMLILFDKCFASEWNDIWKCIYYGIIGFALFVVVVIVTFREIRIDDERHNNKNGDC